MLIIFNPEDGSYMPLLNVGKKTTRPQNSTIHIFLIYVKTSNLIEHIIIKSSLPHILGGLVEARYTDSGYFHFKSIQLFCPIILNSFYPLRRVYKSLAYKLTSLRDGSLK